MIQNRIIFDLDQDEQQDPVAECNNGGFWAALHPVSQTRKGPS